VPLGLNQTISYPEGVNEKQRESKKLDIPGKGKTVWKGETHQSGPTKGKKLFPQKSRKAFRQRPPLRGRSSLRRRPPFRGRSPLR